MSGVDCCSGYCNSEGICAPDDDSCVPLGGECTTDEDCCSEHCDPETHRCTSGLI